MILILLLVMLLLNGFTIYRLQQVLQRLHDAFDQCTALDTMLRSVSERVAALDHELRG